MPKHEHAKERRKIYVLVVFSVFDGIVPLWQRCLKEESAGRNREGQGRIYGALLKRERERERERNVFLKREQWPTRS